MNDKSMPHPRRRKATGARSVEPAAPGDTKSDVRQRLLQAAIGLLQTQSFSALTQARVAELAGVRQSHLTYYFPTRNELLKAVIEADPYALGGMMSKLEKPTLKKIKSTLIEMAQQQSKPRLMLSLIMAAEEDPSLKTWMKSFAHGTIDELAAVLRQVGLHVAEDDLHLFNAAMVGALVMGLSGTGADTAAATAKTVSDAFKKLVLEKSKPIPMRRQVERR